MIKFQVVKYQLIGQVVEKFGAFIKKGCVVFISFGDKEVSAAIGTTSLQIFSNSANQKPWIHTSVGKSPSE